MKLRRMLFTSESVAIGHPDKVADQISDAVLDEIMEQDPTGRVACETMVSTGMVIVAGEITTQCYADIPSVVRDTIHEIGYTDPAIGFDSDNCAILTAIEPQSADIDLGVSEDTGLHKEQGAGDQGMMCGFACRETPEFMPMPIQLSHRLMENLARLRTEGTLPYLRPDGKGQVTVEYENGTPVRVHTVVISTQHDEDVDHDTIRADMIEKLIRPTVPEGMLDLKTIYHVNPTGRFVVGGPKCDCGMTGRKIIVDTYGGRAPHGGGAFSGKDPTKVDRTATYAARHAAKNIVAAGLADICHVYLCYAIGIAQPLAIHVDTEGTAKIKEKHIVEFLHKHFDFRPKAMIERLNLQRPIFKKTASFGHFGRELPTFTWEKLDMVDTLRNASGV